MRLELQGFVNRFRSRVEYAGVERGPGPDGAAFCAAPAHAHLEALPLFGRGVRLRHVAAHANIALES
jgi:hypothetical protein